MSRSSLLASARTLVGQFARGDQGNVAVMFAIALLPIVGFIGVAVDYTRANNARSSMQSALDSAALMVSKDNAAGTLSASDLTAKAQAYFSALYTKTSASNIAITATYSSSATSGNNIVLTGSGTIATDFMRVAGFPNMNFNTSSTTTWGITKLRVALALDNTGSMADAGKMAALIPAAKNLIDQLKSSAANPGDVYISVVPFSRDVNVGSSNYNQNWLDFSQWDTVNQTCTAGGGGKKKGGGTVCTANPHYTWTGCVTDRDQNYDIQKTAPTTSNASTLFVAEEYSECPVQLMPLSYDWSALKAKIDSMTPSGNTNQAIGLAWGWLSLNQTAPLSAPAESSSYNYTKAIILMTDGLNTQNRWTIDPTQIDARQASLCNNIKADGVTIYTVQVNTDGDPTQSVLQNCASGSDKFFILTSANQLMAAFNAIGSSLSKLRIAR